MMIFFVIVSSRSVTLYSAVGKAKALDMRPSEHIVVPNEPLTITCPKTRILHPLNNILEPIIINKNLEFDSVQIIDQSLQNLLHSDSDESDNLMLEKIITEILETKVGSYDTLSVIYFSAGISIIILLIITLFCVKCKNARSQFL